MSLQEILDQTISDFCGNGFVASSDNHCAHFVSHVLGLDAGYDCAVHMQKQSGGASLRVQELFAACPDVGVLKDAPAGVPLLVFVTAISNVDVAAHTMRNVPQKHVGIFDGTHIYNYSNSQRRVVRQTPPEFLARFAAIYSGRQGLFFGTMPLGADLSMLGNDVPTPHVFPVAPAAAVRPVFEIRQQAVRGDAVDYFAKTKGAAEFHVARSVSYGNHRGLYQSSRALSGPVYSAREYSGLYGPAAAMVGAIAAGESGGRFNRLNSYDRAGYTFGFFQLAAHTPNDNLILLFRRLAAEHGDFQKQFPDLQLRNGRLHRMLDADSALNLEREYPRPDKPSETNLKDFMSYLNPDGSQVDDVEIDNSARLVWLANNDPVFNAIQVNVAVEITMQKLRRSYDVSYDLDGESDMLCTAIADIHHQGRGKKIEVRAALALDTPARKLDALCQIGSENYAERCQTLRRSIRAARAAGELGNSVYDRASGLFRPSAGWVD